MSVGQFSTATFRQLLALLSTLELLAACDERVSTALCGKYMHELYGLVSSLNEVFEIGFSYNEMCFH